VKEIPAAIVERLGSGGDGLKILIVRLGALGDVIRTLPALRRLQRGLPDARFEWAVDSPWAPILECVEGLDAVHAFPRGAFKRAGRRLTGWPEAFRLALAWRRTLADRSFGLAIDFHGNLRGGVSSRFSAAPLRLGYDGRQQKEGNRWFQTHRLRLDEPRQSRIERNMALADALLTAAGRTVDKTDPSPVGFRWPEGLASAIPQAPGSPGYAIVAPTVSRAQAYKSPPTELLTAAIHAIVRRGLTPWISWGPGERDQAQALADSCEHEVRILPDTDLPTLGATIAEAKLFVGGDTGPMHLACASAVPTLVLYGPTDPQINTPWSPRFKALAPAVNRYSGVKRHDRKFRFDGIDPLQVEEAVIDLTTG
jgi:ADP-heptose:LPS heptosyltransferase